MVSLAPIHPWVSSFAELTALPWPFRNMTCLALFAGLLFTAVTAQPNPFFNEQILAQGLIGSHFGVPGLPGSFDYVVVGGGTAGNTLARRLAANTSFTVAVVEAGDFYEFSNGNFSEIPVYASAFIGSNPVLKNPLLDWYQYTERQPVSTGALGDFV